MKFLRSGSPLVASNFMSDNHMAGYSHFFEIHVFPPIKGGVLGHVVV